MPFPGYKGITQDLSYEFKDPVMSRHIKAKKKIKERNYQEAIKLLTQA